MASAFTIILTLMLAFIGLGLGATIEFKDVIRCIKDKRLAVFTGAATQFGLMPLIAYIFIKIFSIRSENAIGLILVACAPGGVTSNLLTYYSLGDVALSITMSAVSTLLSFGFLPFLVFIYLENALDITGIKIPYDSIALSLLTLIAPAALGVCIRSRTEKYALYVEKMGSIVGLVFLAAAFIHALVTNIHLFRQTFGIWFSSMTLQIIGSFFGYLCAWSLKLTNKDKRTIAIEAGLQNVTLIIAMIQLSFPKDERETILVCVYIYSLAFIWNSLFIVLLFRFYLSPRDPEAPLEADNVKNKPSQDGIHLEAKANPTSEVTKGLIAPGSTLGNQSNAPANGLSTGGFGSENPRTLNGSTAVSTEPSKFGTTDPVDSV
ncbi:hypothetical protein AAMO2058_001285100 [Amorphochlora amoebiformis]|uniref:Uncharacterized protein n=1 Tax=Amorphochlora amoebiformis TaxID=1561963 RepID=A0A7S0CTW8_9EUKA|mmetsp:Transcript_13709/g.21708  ORF Transcript_13709/g.21708 Transcript_13709/m.21708 type:complete len:377 (+) Transcript_13709:81-1211(+)